ncbi:DNA-3-methyladenine glycosylase [Nocardioides humilatus]|uniref:Putative 3-methyladenine DNA glycosylase n=1 Tax=Nocardioides humilatus TaxID=2607660 RepID=A0A5B1L645_9ACTN|nr:DNA-3-methyladenine glycosylase [Nocardioides humilatus]KAA1415249.1 DNA-3-methyladenine glycosylase [Nocardioides humilatus]
MSALAELLNGPVEEVAPRLLGAVVRHGPVAVRLTEVEAYDGANDPASHAFRGPTDRNRVMFGPAGHLYCYLSHGIHVCGNVSVGPEGSASGVLMRAGELVDGIDVVRALRPGVADRDLARGPGRLGRALGLRLDLNGTDLATGQVTVTPGESPARISSGPRTGVRNAAERAWRFWTTGDPTVSPYRRHAHASGL